MRVLPRRQIHQRGSVEHPDGPSHDRGAPIVNHRLQARTPFVAKRWRDGTARVRWNEYADDDHEEAISTFVEVEAAIEHFPGAGMVLVRGSTVGALRPAAPWRAVKRATLWVRTGRPEPASSQQAM